ncbi:HNH endonuclease [Salmonella enterica subsp. enterica serovar Cerro]|nr:HNH endonuclease [Salmonella enterica subsp. enterica serovar Cerro]
MIWATVFDYDKNTGALTWRVSPNNRIKIGSPAGSVNPGTGYVHVKVFKRNRMAHRIVWDMHNPNDTVQKGEEIDHINHNKTDNRIENLRKVDCAVNQRNRPQHKDNTSGVTGVCWYKRHNCWRVQIRAKGKPKHIGYFDNFDAAVETRKDAEVEYGFHENHGKKRGV